MAAKSALQRRLESLTNILNTGEMLDLLWPVIEAAQVADTGLVQSLSTAKYAGFGARDTMNMALTDLYIQLERLGK